MCTMGSLGKIRGMGLGLWGRMIRVWWWGFGKTGKVCILGLKKIIYHDLCIIGFFALNYYKSLKYIYYQIWKAKNNPQAPNKTNKPSFAC